MTTTCALCGAATNGTWECTGCAIEEDARMVRKEDQ